MLFCIPSPMTSVWYTQGIADSVGGVVSQVISRLFSDDVGFSFRVGSAFPLYLVLS